MQIHVLVTFGCSHTALELELEHCLHISVMLLHFSSLCSHMINPLLMLLPPQVHQFKSVHVRDKDEGERQAGDRKNAGMRER